MQDLHSLEKAIYQRIIVAISHTTDMFKVRHFRELRLQKLRVSLRAAIKVSNYFQVSSTHQCSSDGITATKNSVEISSKLLSTNDPYISVFRIEQEFVPARKYLNSLVLPLLENGLWFMILRTCLVEDPPLWKQPVVLDSAH